MADPKKLGKIARAVREAVSHYEVLGVAVSAKAEDIKRAHRERAGLLHPDRCKLPDAHDLTARLNGAYACLSDRVERGKYNSIHLNKVEHCTKCEGAGHWLRQKGFKAKVKVDCEACGGTGVAR